MQRALRNLPNIRAVQKNFSTADVIQARDQVDDGTFAGPGASDNGKGLTLMDAERNILHRVFLRALIGVGYMVKRQ